ncbi:MAG: DUF1499 domain-containing protein [Erythrobacter sp.]|jgi:uncharacterized protein (DUF1499 family)|nr:DUF1499 domain-containing protein [Erythrobacter sp.]
MKTLPWHAKLVLALLILLPLFFAIAALGTKFGVWGWQFGLVTLTFSAGLWFAGILGVAALISLILALIKKPRRGVVIAIAAIGIIVPLAVVSVFASARSAAGNNPIHDVATDTSDPPQFSAATMNERRNAGANLLIDYTTPLGETELFAGAEPELAIRNHAQIINDNYSDLSPLPLGGASRADAVAAVAAAMGNMGLVQISTDAEAGRVEAVAESFWFGFKDDVVARIGEDEIDFRSVSRVGRSDLGANAERIAKLRERVAELIGQR